MSGVEVAGLVLGALPLLFAAVDLQKDGMRRGLLAFRKRAYVGKLSRALLLHRQIVAENMKAIASASGCEEIWLVDESPLRYLEEEKVREQILDFLGQENYTALAGALDASYEIVKKVGQNIAGLLPGGKGPTDDLLAIITANQCLKGKLDVVPRVKLLFRVNDLKSAVEELDATAAAVDRFTRVLLSNQQMAKDAPSRRAVRLAKALRTVRGFAANLYLALHNGWDGCHIQHEADLFLEDRLSEAAAITERHRARKNAPALLFHLVLTASICQGQWLSYQTAVRVYDGDDSGLDHPGTPAVSRQDTASTQVTLVAPGTTAPTPLDVRLVSNICGALASAAGTKRGVSLVLTKNQHMGVTLTDETPLMPSGKQGKRLTLKEYLSLALRSRHNTPLKHRMMLALRLASNLLQLLQTSWLQAPWSKEAVYFLLQPGKGAQNSSPLGLVDLDQPFISLVFDDQKSVEQPRCQIQPRVALLELGILLLELWHQQPFEARFGQDSTADGYYQRLAMAIEWLDDTSDPMPEQYDRAVSLCVRGVIGGESHLASWEDIGFWGAICADVIEPLQKNCKLWQRT
ncbi:hypothetical protein NKR23_g4735 [Pleurostoma richardsiae]|uniref:DUF7580 domain-containing protein n=1 Tax=Pleurostoma richardsiae TaxID=41990 RepID=A0AA38RHX8_9PEZI|nr:hypothetical protein NKR23_g4735 [Pleurostoma richardsiae]